MGRNIFSGWLVLWLAASSFADEHDRLRVGRQADGRIVVPTNQILQPAGQQVEFPGRPVDLLLLNPETLVVKNIRELLFVNPKTGAIRQTLAMTAPKSGRAGGLSAIGLIRVGERVLVTDTQSGVRVALPQANGTYKWEKDYTLKAPAVGGAVYPTGMAAHDAQHVWVCSSRGNEVQLLNLESGKVETTVPVGVSPFAIVAVSDDTHGQRYYVSNWGGEPTDDPKALTSSKTPIRTDPRTNAASSGTVSVIRKTAEGWKQDQTIAVGLHPSGMVAQGKLLFVANAASDTVSVIDTHENKVVETIDVKPDGKLPFGSGANALAVDANRLYVANGTNNCVAVVDLTANPKKMLGLIPTGWYPGAIVATNDQLLVANIKGVGSLSLRREEAKGKNSHDHMGSLSLINRAQLDLPTMTKTVNANNRLGYSLAGLEKPRAGVKPVPVPVRHGEPSVFEHVIYVIKENRTYDQVFGDMKEGNGDPNLCIFPEKVTPNHHKLAREFVLLDNFYCSGVLSADGHQWVTEAYCVDYLERQFGGFTRSYPYDGGDPLAYSPTGFLWDNVLSHKKTFFNFGEFCQTTTEPRGAKWKDLYNDYLNGTSKVKIKVTPTLQSIAALTHPDFPGFPINISDAYRARLFQEQFAKWEQAGKMPNLVFLFLPADHTEGTKPESPTPQAMVADNDLALGKVVELVSKSKFWSKTCIMVTEDDPQNGFDHVDGHRTVGLVISPYTRRRAIDSTCYNQTGMVKTIELMLGLPPMNQMDLSATPMRGCFTDTPDLTAYKSVPNQIPLDQMNPPLSKLSGSALHWARKSMELDFEKEDLADEDLFNRILWFAQRGDAPYPGEK